MSEGSGSNLDRAPKSAGTPLKTRVKETVMKAILSEQPFREEDYDPRKVARDILDYTANPVREGLGHDPYTNPFDIRTILSNKGQVRAMRKPESDAYRAARSALEHLVQTGALDKGEFDRELHGERIFYKVSDPELLRRISTQRD